MPAAAGSAGWRTARVAGHFGELLQGRYQGDVALVTLPCPALAVTARWLSRVRVFSARQTPQLMTRDRIRALFRHVLGAPPTGLLRIAASMPPGAGAGASTAGIIAVARALGEHRPEALLALCRALEGASDPLMLSDPGRLLWASREGRVIERSAAPEFEVFGGYLGPPVRTDPEDDDFAPIDDLVASWRATADLSRLAQIATESAIRNAAHRGGSDPAPLLAAMHDTCALGIVAAHTGSARGLLFAPGTADRDRVGAALRAAGVAGLVNFRAGSGS